MFDRSGTDIWRMLPYQHFGVHFFQDFEVDLKNEAKIEVQNAHMGASAKYRSLKGQTLEENSKHDFEEQAIVILVLCSKIKC